MFAYRWSLKETKFTKDKGTVFSCFACGGGSTMGYKLAGFDVIGANEIDSVMAACYKLNHNPKHLFVEDIKDFNKRVLSKEFYNLDILDGSPPCSSFSMAGSRQRKWGVSKKFKEGQKKQVLDDLFFDFIATAKKLQPKIVIAENVKGLLQGNAKYYISRIYRDFDLAGYKVNHWLLDASKMGVPQKRERVFFIALRKDLVKKVKPLELDFNYRVIPFKEAEVKELGRPLTLLQRKYWQKTPYGKSLSYAHPEKKWFTMFRVDPEKPMRTLLSTSANSMYHYSKPNHLSTSQWCVLQSFPIDYKHSKGNDLKYLVAMSVPPVMIAELVSQIYKQWLTKI